jgi:hypothetical protein
MLCWTVGEFPGRGRFGSGHAERSPGDTLDETPLKGGRTDPFARIPVIRRPFNLNRKLNLLIYILVALGAAASLWISAARWGVEDKRRTVELVCDWTQIQDVASHTQRPMERILRDLKTHGVWGMAVGEDSVAGLKDDGFLEVEAIPQPDNSIRTVVSSFDPALLERVKEHLFHKLNLTEPLKATRSKAGNPAFVWPGNFEQIRGISVGLAPADVQQLQSAGFDVVARIVNYDAANPSNIEWSLQNLKRLGVRKIIFGGEEVLGFQAQVKETARLLLQDGLTYGSVEFSKQRGDETISNELKGQYLRVHSITPAELNKLKPEETVERYVRAAQERNIRLAFVRLLPGVTQNGFQDQLDFLDGIGKGLDRSGLKIGQAEVYDRLGVPVPARWAVGLGAAAGVIWLLATVLPLGEGFLSLMLVVLAVIHVGLLAGTEDLGRKLIALESAMLFPTLSMAILYGFLRYRFQERQPFSILGVYLGISGFSALGALYVVGLLSTRVYMMKAQQFAGIKAAHFLPLLVLGILFSLDFIADHRTRTEMVAAAKRRMAETFSQPILIWQMLAAFLGLMALAMLLLRTGNDPGVGVSPLEMRFRSILDKILYVRPRTKEFLIGHPALIFALTWAASRIKQKMPSETLWRDGRALLVCLLLIGAIGQVSIVNTFCHIHTPLKISVIRVLNGIWVGAIIGGLVYRLLSGRRQSPSL